MGLKLYAFENFCFNKAEEILRLKISGREEEEAEGVNELIFANGRGLYNIVAMVTTN